MNSERDYSVRLPVGTPEISTLQTVTNRKEPRRRRPGKDKDKDKDKDKPDPAHDEVPDADAVEVDLKEEPAEADQTPPADRQESKTPRPGGVDYLA